MTRWPQPLAHRWTFVDAVSQATPLAIVKEKLKDGLAFADISPMLPNYVDLFMGKQGGCLGEISALLLLLGGFYLLAKKVIRWHIPVFVIGTVFIFSALLWQSAPERFAPPLFHLLTGGLFLGAIYMATDLVTSPMTIGGMIIFAIGIGILTVLIRVFGAYPEGMSFAILIMNAFVPLIDQFTKPKKYGKVAHG